MKIKIPYNNNYITPYNTNIEKDILLYGSLDENKSIDGVLEILKENFSLDIAQLSEEDKIVLLYKLRSISIGEEININYTCTSCKRGSETVLNVSELVTESSITNNLIKDRFKTLTDNNFQEFITTNVDELSIDEYDKLYEECSNTITKYKFTQEKECYYCKTPHIIKIDNPNFIIDNLSEDSLMSLYQTTADLVFFGHYTKNDIDNMIPFERSIFVGILNKTREKLNQGN